MQDFMLELEAEIKERQKQLNLLRELQRQLRMHGLCGDDQIWWEDQCLEGDLDSTKQVDFAFRRWEHEQTHFKKPSQWVYETKGV